MHSCAIKSAVLAVTAMPQRLPAIERMGSLCSRPKNTYIEPVSPPSGSRRKDKRLLIQEKQKEASKKGLLPFIWQKKFQSAEKPGYTGTADPAVLKNSDQWEGNIF
ncbi:hypothetical protein [Ructibacterium gallinarum]|uniref:Uncharacterized protein n=1 Tax=Ructibacterium gallinarum TaxID=2779355 RepID=A0A9D5M111_9FIRM|nr:hypothetical protein [Ructibacterium gallinarum]MBE5040657.1 hypothetical protein [Ructibacterium gallinarum]